MTKEKYDELVELVIEKDSLHPPRCLFNDIHSDDLEHKLSSKIFLGRFLLREPLELYDEALEVFKDALSDMEGKDLDANLIREKVRILHLMAGLLNNVDEGEAALGYANQAIELAESVDYWFDYFITLGDLVYTKLQIMYFNGLEDEALAEAEKIIAEHTDSPSINDSYWFYAWRFKAWEEVNNPAKVKEYMLKAYEGLDLSNERALKSRTMVESINIENLSAEDVFDWTCPALFDVDHGVTWWDVTEIPTWEEEKRDTITKENYEELVSLVCQTGDIRPPKAIFDGNFEDWRVRAQLARWLMRPQLNRKQDAIDLLKTVVDVPINEQSPEEDIDQMAWALRDLSELEREQGEKELALKHIEQAIKLAESRNAAYSFTVRGNLLYHKFEILRSLGREQEAEALADAMIADHKNSAVKNDSYVFYGYLFKARLAVAKENPDEVKEFMLKALDGIDPADETATESRAELKSIDTDNVSAEDVFNKMYRVLPDAYHDIVWWDMTGNPPWEKENKSNA